MNVAARIVALYVARALFLLAACCLLSLAGCDERDGAFYTSAFIVGGIIVAVPAVEQMRRRPPR